MQGTATSKPHDLTPEQIAALIPEDIKELRELSLALISTDVGKRWLLAMKQYYIMKEAVALPNHPKAYCYFREGQNSLLRTIETFAAEEDSFNKAMTTQLLGRG